MPSKNAMMIFRGFVTVVAYVMALRMILIPESLLDRFVHLYFTILFATPIVMLVFGSISQGPTGEKDSWGDPIYKAFQDEEKLEWATTRLVHYIGVPAIIISMIMMGFDSKSVRGTYFGGGRK